jgi:hypothetical protein
MTRTRLAGLILLALVPVFAAPAAHGQTMPDSDWRAFEGTWSASGQRQILPTVSGRPAGTFQLSGALALTSGEGLSRGFRGEAIGFDDGSGALAGQCVWTDERGDRVYSQLKGESVASGRRISGTITGGTGRYAGISGDYSFEWQYVVEAEAGTIQGRAVGLKGRYRVTGAGK